MRFFIALITLVVSSASYAACIQKHQGLSGLVGLDSAAGYVFAELSLGQQNCGCSYVRFKPDNTNVQMSLSILMAAKVSEKKVRVDFRNEADCNSGYRVYIE